VLEELFEVVRAHQFALAVIAGLVSLGGVILVPVMVTWIPHDYFAHRKAPPLPWAEAHPVWRLLLRVAKNLVGGVLLVSGVAMLVLPGQGLLTILLGLMLMDFPGKRRLEMALVRRPRVARALNWIRARAGKGELEVGRWEVGD